MTNIGYGTAVCPGCKQEVALYVMGYFVHHLNLEGKTCGWSFWR